MNLIHTWLLILQPVYPPQSQKLPIIVSTPFAEKNTHSWPLPVIFGYNQIEI